MSSFFIQHVSSPRPISVCSGGWCPCLSFQGSGQGGITANNGQFSPDGGAAAPDGDQYAFFQTVGDFTNSGSTLSSSVAGLVTGASYHFEFWFNVRSYLFVGDNTEVILNPSPWSGVNLLWGTSAGIEAPTNGWVHVVTQSFIANGPLQSFYFYARNFNNADFSLLIDALTVVSDA